MSHLASTMKLPRPPHLDFSEPFPAPDDQLHNTEDDDNSSQNAKDVSNNLTLTSSWVEERVDVEALGIVCQVGKSEVQG
jgi:hypothetical protein